MTDTAIGVYCLGLIAFLVFALVVTIWQGVTAAGGPTIYDECDARGGVVADTGGKAATYFCIRDGKVVFTR